MTEAVEIADLPDCTRLILRGGAAAIAAVAGPLGFAPPVDVCRATVVGDRAALWLGPDEWLILVPTSDAAKEQFADALRSHMHALVDVSHRQVALRIGGRGAADLINAGCPLDLHPAAFPAGMCTRTVLAKTEILLWRVDTESFRIEVARSFARYLRDFLREAARG
jgi:sarcosine oxidase subunit gamma